VHGVGGIHVLVWVLAALEAHRKDVSTRVAADLRALALAVQSAHVYLIGPPRVLVGPHNRLHLAVIYERDGSVPVR